MQQNSTNMAHTNSLPRLPFDIQSFYEIRTKGMFYVDKTDLVYDLVQSGKYVFLSRPRRFGKSLLCDTLRCYFEGRKELFEGLKIMDLETEWRQHPVIRLDMSGINGTVAGLASRLNATFGLYEKQYGLEPLTETTELALSPNFGVRFERLIMEAYNQTGQQVVVLIDEYDRPLQQTWNTPEHEPTRVLYRSVLEMLKPLGDYLRFVFLTGITKFTQLSLFSSINNLRNISFDGRYAALCGITEEELHTCLADHIAQLAEARRMTVEETYARLKANYDGYHFSDENMVDLYNPFSLLNAIGSERISNYWASSGATTILTKFVPDLVERINDYADNYLIDRDTLETSDITTNEYGLFMYQSGYLTIKDFNDFSYTLCFPNEEVRQALYKMVLPSVMLRDTGELRSTQVRLAMALSAGDVPMAFDLLKAQVADVPYSNIKYAERIMHIEERYRLIITIVLRALGFRVEVERMQAGGRPDIVLYTPKFTYILELKTESNGGVAAAAQQIRDRNYIEPFLQGTHPSSDAARGYAAVSPAANGYASVSDAANGYAAVSPAAASSATTAAEQPGTQTARLRKTSIAAVPAAYPEVIALAISVQDEGKGLIEYVKVEK